MFDLVLRRGMTALVGQVGVADGVAERISFRCRPTSSDLQRASDWQWVAAAAIDEDDARWSPTDQPTDDARTSRSFLESRRVIPTLHST